MTGAAKIIKNAGASENSSKPVLRTAQRPAIDRSADVYMTGANIGKAETATARLGPGPKNQDSRAARYEAWRRALNHPGGLGLSRPANATAAPMSLGEPLVSPPQPVATAEIAAPHPEVTQPAAANDTTLLAPQVAVLDSERQTSRQVKVENTRLGPIAFYPWQPPAVELGAGPAPQPQPLETRPLAPAPPVQSEVRAAYAPAQTVENSPAARPGAAPEYAPSPGSAAARYGAYFHTVPTNLPSAGR